MCHWPTKAAQLAVSCCRPVPQMMDGQCQTSCKVVLYTGAVYAHALLNNMIARVTLWMLPSTRARTNVRARRVPLEAGRRFHILQPPIISRPDKTPVCWRSQDQTVMSRQLCAPRGRRQVAVLELSAGLNAMCIWKTINQKKKYYILSLNRFILICCRFVFMTVIGLMRVSWNVFLIFLISVSDMKILSFRRSLNPRFTLLCLFQVQKKKLYKEVYLSFFTKGRAEYKIFGGGSRRPFNFFLTHFLLSTVAASGD